MKHPYQENEYLQPAQQTMHPTKEGWFEVSGDLDDFIFYWEDCPNVSER